MWHGGPQHLLEKRGSMSIAKLQWETVPRQDSPIDAKIGQNHISPNLQRDLLWAFVLLSSEDSAQQSMLSHSGRGILNRVIIPSSCKLQASPSVHFLLTCRGRLEVGKLSISTTMVLC